MESDREPQLYLSPFRCPYCRVVAQQDWQQLYWQDDDSSFNDAFIRATLLVDKHITFFLFTAQCSNCTKASVWRAEGSSDGEGAAKYVNGRMLFPSKSSTEQLPEGAGDVAVQCYSEAKSIADKSPRAAAALLRVTIEAVCRQVLGERNGTLAELIEKIGEKHHLSETVLDAMTALRLIGNSAVHPGQIDLENRDSNTTVNELFMLADYIYEQIIELPRKIQQISASIKKNRSNNINEKE